MVQWSEKKKNKKNLIGICNVLIFIQLAEVLMHSPYTDTLFILAVPMGDVACNGKWKECKRC